MNRPTPKVRWDRVGPKAGLAVLAVVALLALMTGVALAAPESLTATRQPTTASGTGWNASAVRPRP